MQTLKEDRIASLLMPYVEGLTLPPTLYASVSTYLDLLLRWNTRTNLTAVRDPEQIVQRQVGESLLAARFVQPGATVLDFGTGAGFPGIPLQLAQPTAALTLAESQGKKASFLREAVRTLELKCTVWADRVENIPADRRFDVVIMRAVDDSERMTVLAAQRVVAGGSLLRYSGQEGATVLPGWQTADEVVIPLSPGRLVRQTRDCMFHVEHKILR